VDGSKKSVRGIMKKCEAKLHDLRSHARANRALADAEANAGRKTNVKACQSFIHLEHFK
jgi:hypothetical protein